METQQAVVQDPAPELKAERVQGELTEEPFRIWLKAERVQEPSSLLSSLGGPVSLAYEMSFNQMRAVTVHLEEPQIVINLFAIGGQEAA